jgi:hypothetical protein
MVMTFSTRQTASQASRSLPIRSGSLRSASRLSTSEIVCIWMARGIADLARVGLPLL